MTALNIVGIGGLILYILAYGLLQTGRLESCGIRYASLNIAAASMVLVSLIVSFNLASALIQVMWIAVSLVGLGRNATLRPARPPAAGADTWPTPDGRRWVPVPGGRLLYVSTDAGQSWRYAGIEQRSVRAGVD